MEKKNNSLLVQGSILALAGILTKIIGFIYRIPMANLLGEQGNGIYSVSFGIYNVALTLSSYSLPLALSKLISTRLAKGEKKNSYILFKRALLFATIAGICAFAVLFFGAEWLEALYSRVGLAHPLRVLAPTAFAVALLGVFRGYFQGHSNMIPTAISQIVEQIINAIVSIVASYFFMKAFINDPNVAAYGASGATMGTLAGAFGALIMLSLLFASKLRIIRQETKCDENDTESRRTSYTDIVVTMIPIILSQTIYQIGFTMDDLIYGNVMASKGFDDAVVSSLQGVFNTQFTQLINLPIAIATSLAASALPSIASLFTLGRNEEKNKKITSVIKLTIVVSIPSAVGLSVLAKPIVATLYPSLVDYRTVAISLLAYGSISCVFYALSTITTSVLQGNERMKLPVINSAISFAIHVVLVLLLLNFTDLSIYALLIGDITFPLVIAILNIISLKKKAQYTLDVKGIFVKPIIASCLMGIIIFLTDAVISSNLVSLLISLTVGVIIYFVLVIKLKVFTDEEIIDLPLGRKILKMSNKIKYRAKAR